MNLLRTFVIAALLQVGAQAPVQQAPAAGSIEGVVLRAASGEPLSRTQVKLSRVLTAEEAKGFGKFGPDPEASPPSVFTDNNGRFSFKEVDAGSYHLIASRNGYSEQLYGRKVPDGPGTTVNVLPGQSVRNIEFRLVQAGVITGRVRDAFGEPAAGFGVKLMRVGYGYDGQKELQAFDEERTDDRGEYRFFWIEPGRYYVRIGAPENSNSKPPITDRPIPPAYYPGTLDLENASMVDVRPGGELGGVDIVIPDIRGYSIRGRIVDGATGKPPQSVDIQIARKRQLIRRDGDRGARVDYDSKTGAFELRNVMPGAYWLTASAGVNLEASISPDALSEARTGLDVFKSMFSSTGEAVTSIDMPTSDINNVVLTLKKGETIPVRFSVEGQALSSARGIAAVRVALFPVSEVRGNNESTSMNAEGAARLEGVAPGEYRVVLNSGPDTDLYAKEILYGRSDVLDNPMLVTDRSPATLTVLLSTKGGRISGTISDALSQPAKDAQVVLIPDRRERWNLFQVETTDDKGQYSFESIPPGGYRVFSWEVLEPRSYYDNDVLSKYETQGRPVRIQESSKETVDLKIIPAPKQ